MSDVEAIEKSALNMFNWCVENSDTPTIFKIGTVREQTWSYCAPLFCEIFEKRNLISKNADPDQMDELSDEFYPIISGLFFNSELECHDDLFEAFCDA